MKFGENLLELDFICHSRHPFDDVIGELSTTITFLMMKMKDVAFLSV